MTKYRYGRSNQFKREKYNSGLWSTLLADLRDKPIFGTGMAYNRVLYTSIRAYYCET